MFLLAFAESIQLFPDGTIFIHIGLILLMIWVLNRTFFKPINRVIESREKHKGGHSGEAATILSQADEKEAKYAQEMLEARSKGYSLIEREHSTGVADREKKLAAVRDEAAAKLGAEKSELERQTAEARTALASEAGAIADKIAANILKG